MVTINTHVDRLIVVHYGAFGVIVNLNFEFLTFGYCVIQRYGYRCHVHRPDPSIILPKIIHTNYHNCMTAYKGQYEIHNRVF